MKTNVSLAPTSVKVKESLAEIPMVLIGAFVPEASSERMENVKVRVTNDFYLHSCLLLPSYRRFYWQIFGGT